MDYSCSGNATDTMTAPVGGQVDCLTLGLLGRELCSCSKEFQIFDD
jgi:hypothetical protein